MSTDSKSIRLVTAIVECRPDGEYAPWGIKWYDGTVYPFEEIESYKPRSWALGNDRACESWRVVLADNKAREKWPTNVNSQYLSVSQISRMVSGCRRPMHGKLLRARYTDAYRIKHQVYQPGRSIFPGISTRWHLCWAHLVARFLAKHGYGV